jgi:GntR family transcriptional regulator/MocR family aminotransferase
VIIPGLQIDLNSSVPVYRQIAEAVRDAALDGRLQPGHRLPPTRDLARRLGVNRNTVVAAYEMLAGEGWIESHTGKGTFLVSRPNASGGDDDPAPEADTWFTAFSRTAEDASAGGLQSIYSLAIATDGISFVGSYPAGELMPVEAFGRAMATTLREQGAQVLGYGPTAGHPPLRESIAEAMRAKGSAADAESILVTNGAQQALELVFRAFLERGDAVVIEEPTYTGALSILGALGARIVAVPVDDEGIRPDLLTIALGRHRPRLVYVQPTFHNPTTRVMSEARRRELLLLAQRHRCPLVEDDWGGDLRLEGEELPTLHALDGGRHVIYVGTFSRKLMPGLRVGWIAAPQPVLDRLIELKRLEDCGTSPILQSSLHTFLRDQGLETHLERVRPAYRTRRDAMLRALGRHFPEEARWTTPLGGMFVWVNLPSSFDGQELFVAAQQKGVSYSRGELFHSDGSGRNCFRLTYSAASPEQIETGVAQLGSLIRELWPGAPAPTPRTVEAMPIF